MALSPNCCHHLNVALQCFCSSQTCYVSLHVYQVQLRSGPVMLCRSARPLPPV